MRFPSLSVVVFLLFLSSSFAKTQLYDVEVDNFESSQSIRAIYHIRSDTPILSGYNDVCCSTCNYCTSDDCCGYSSSTNLCYFCTNGTCCGSSSNPSEMGCCAPGYECCMDCSNSTINGGPIWGCALTGTCDCYPSSNQCLDDTCCPPNRQCGTTCCASDEFCCLGECFKQNDDNYTCCEYSANVFFDPVGNTCPKSQSTCCTFSGQTDCCPDNSTCCDSSSCGSDLKCCGGCNCCKECNDDGSCKPEPASQSLLSTILGIAVPVAVVLAFLLCCCCVLRRVSGRKKKYHSRAAQSDNSRYNEYTTSYNDEEYTEVPMSSYSQPTRSIAEEEAPKTAKDMFKRYSDEEYADWNPGLDMFKALIGDLNDPWYKKAFTMIMSIVGIVETVLYILQLKDYFSQGDYVYGGLSAASLLMFTIYTCYLTIMEVITVWEKPIGALLLGAFLGIMQLGHTFTLIVCYSGKGSIVRDDDVGSVLKKMELWKIAIFSMPQGSLALYLALLNAENLSASISTGQTVLAILFSIATIAFSLSDYYRDHTTSKFQIILCMLYLIPMVALRYATFGIIPLTETYFLFPYIAIGVFIRYFISNAKLGDPMHDRFVKVISAVMFTFIINIDPSVAYWPVLLVATLETVIGIGVSIYYPYNREVPFLENNAKYFIAVILILLAIMIIFGMILRIIVIRMHEDNLVSMFYRWTIDPKERMTLKQGERGKSLQKVAMPDAFTTREEIRRYRGDPPPSLMVNIKKKTFNNGSLSNMTRQFRANPALIDILAFRADEFAKAGLYKEAIADCTFAMNPYFGFRYEPIGLGFNSFNNKLILARFSVNNGSDSLIPRLLLTRASCLLELGELDLAFQDRRRLLLACKIMGNPQLLEMLQTNAFPSQTGKAHLEIDHEFIKILAQLP